MLSNFSINFNSSALGPFSYNLSLDRTKKNYITKVVGRTDSDGKTALFVEEIYDKMLDKVDIAFYGKINTSEEIESMECATGACPIR